MKKTERCSVFIKDLKFNEQNPRKISKEKLEDLKKSINTLGNFKDVLISDKNKIIAGHQRIKAMQEMGIEVQISATRLIGYTQKELKAISVKDNVLSGEWDYDKLDSWNEDLKEFDFMGDEFNFNSIDDKIKEKDVDVLATENKCPSCGYAW